MSQDPQNYDGASQGISVNGTPMGTTSFMIDGTVNTQIAHGIGAMNSLSAGVSLPCGPGTRRRIFQRPQFSRGEAAA